MTQHEIFYAATEDGKYLVASLGAPAFCFECENEQEAKAKAERALSFYQSFLAHKSNTARTVRVSRATKTLNFVPFKRETLELCAA